jgi:hypothetical protein
VVLEQLDEVCCHVCQVLHRAHNILNQHGRADRPAGNSSTGLTCAGVCSMLQWSSSTDLLANLGIVCTGRHTHRKIHVLRYTCTYDGGCP